MKRFILSLALVSAVSFLYGQETLERQVSDFDKIVVSPYINLVLTEGDEAAVKVEYDGVAQHDIHVEVKGSTLRLYLENARVIEKNFWEDDGYYRGMYSGASVTAYVTFTALEMLEVRGDQNIEVRSEIRTDQFRLKAYGENDIKLAGVKAEFFKVSLFG